jgi:hypothetical protein
MFERVYQYELMEKGGRWYRPRAFANLRPDGHCEGWLVFFPLDRGQPIASGLETTQPTRADVALWAAGLRPVYLDGALERASVLAGQPAVLAHLDAAEYEAFEDAERLETAAAVERAEADVDEAAAEAAREEAARIHQERLRTEGILGAAEEVAATREVEIHEEAAREARARAADAARRAASATAESMRTPPRTVTKRRGTRTSRKKPR